MILIHVTGLQLTTGLRREVFEHIAAALNRHEERVQSVHVYLKDENGPKRGVDKSCRVVVNFSGMSQIVIEDRFGDMAGLLHRVGGRIRQTLARKLTKHRMRKRHLGTGRLCQLFGHDAQNDLAV
jgi:ribosome-associated translation inhibitor RaiA